MSIIQGTSKSSAAGYSIDQSIRFNKDDDAKLTRTFGTATNRRKFTLSVWQKNGSSAGSMLEYNQSGGSTWANITIGAGGRVDVFDYSSGSARIDLRTTRVFRDPSAWVHLVVAFDTTQSTAADRIKVYINGTQETDFGTETYPSQDFDGFLNSAVEHLIGDGVNGPFDGYIAEYYFIDGQQLTPTSFGETNSDTGQWVPIEYTGSYGTNGFYLKGQDSSALGDDSSGNNNDFTSSGLAAADQVTDTPTNNFATWNPIIPLSNGSFSDGNLQFTQSGGSISQHAKSTISFTSGEKKVCEMQTVSGASITLGICDEDFVADANGFSGDSRGYFDTNGNKVDKDGNSSSYGASFSSSNVIRIEVDLSNNPGTIEFFKDGVSQGDAFTDIDSTKTWFFWCRCKADAVKANFGQLGFAGTPTANFTALSTTNLPDPTIALPGDHMNTVLYTGNGATGQSITGVGFQPDWVWTKIRSPNSYSHQLFDAVRGAGLNLQSNNANAEGDISNEFISFDSDGFTIDDVNQNVNESGSSYVSWNWKANGAGSTDSSAGLSATVSANATAGFSIIKYQGTGSATTVPHGLGVAPKMVIVKDRDNSRSWNIYHDGLSAATKVIYLDQNVAESTDGAIFGSAPTSSVVNIATGNGSNGSGIDYIMYAFAEIEGYSSIGRYEGNGSTDGTFIYTGFKPAWIMLKRYDSAGEWEVSDRVRDPDNPVRLILQPNSSGAEWNATTRDIDWLSNGFKHRSSHADFNASGGNYLYIAFAETPFKTSTAR